MIITPSLRLGNVLGHHRQKPGFSRRHTCILAEIMRQPWPAQSKKGFWDLLPGKNPPKFVLEAESSQPFGHYSKNFPARWDRLMVQDSN